MTAQPQETSHEMGLLIGDTVAILNWVVASKGQPRHIEYMPGCFNAKMWACNQKLHTATSVNRNTFNFYITPEGVKFLAEQGVTVPAEAEVRQYQAEPEPEPVEVTAVFVQSRDGRIAQASLVDLPEFVIESLQYGSLAVFDGKLYGLSPEHILGTD